MSTVVTHSRRFHSDEIMAIMLLKRFFFKDKVKIIRTRENNLLKQYTSDPSVFVIDVGFIHDEENLNFDHHQDQFHKIWDDGTPLSSCGLIWQWLRKNNHLCQYMNDVMMDHVEEDIIKKVDAQDNGVGVWPEGLLLSGYNRSHSDNKVIDRQFNRAVEMADSIFENYFYHKKASVRAKKDIMKAVKDSQDKGYKHTVVFKSNLSEGVKVLSDETSSDYHWAVIPKTNKGEWKIQAIPKNSDALFTKRKSFPNEWRGLDGNKLRKISGIPNLEFCHKGGFMLMFKGELREAILLTEGLLK